MNYNEMSDFDINKGAESHVQHLKSNKWFDSEIDYAEVLAYRPKETYPKDDTMGSEE